MCKWYLAEINFKIEFRCQIVNWLTFSLQRQPNKIHHESKFDYVKCLDDHK